MTKKVFRYFSCFLILIIIFSISMLSVYQIPNSALEPQYSKSIAQIEKENVYANYLFDSDASILDNFTDKLMLESCHVSGSYSSSLTAAFDNNGYARYWNGYLSTLRLVLTQFTYQQIRYLNMFLLLILFCFCFSGIHSKLNAVTALGFALSLTACFLVFVSESLQYFSVFMILFIMLLIILYIPQSRQKTSAGILFFAAGMFTSYFDLLTAPLLTLGIPLILILIFEFQEKNSGFTKLFASILILSVSWGAGYGLCWAAKWAIASVITGNNVFADAAATAKFRTAGNEMYPLDRMSMLKLNFDTYFFAKGHKPFIFIALMIIILLILLIRYHKEKWINITGAVLIVGMFPYIWYMIFANHSHLHYFYTYRIQAVTMFAVFSSLGASADFRKIPRFSGSTNL